MMIEVIAKEQLMQFINRLEKLEQEKSERAEDMKEVFAEAKFKGFDIIAMKQVLKLKKLDKEKLAEQEAILELYRQALNL
jgi:uncharacterized protein (UPF0335 family)